MSAILIILIVVLVFLLIVQISKVTELIGTLNKETEEYEEKRNDKLVYVTAFVGFAVLIYCVVSVFPVAHKFLPVSASEHGVWVDKMVRITLFFTGLVFLITQVLLFVFVFRYRYKKGRKATYFPESNNLEALWTIVPAIVLFVLVGFGLMYWNKIFNNKIVDWDTVFKQKNDHVEVFEATAQQFRWTIRYPGEDGILGPRRFELVSPENELGIDWEDETSHDDFIAEEIVLPLGKPFVVDIRSLDVLHNFYLPHFRMKMDAVPGIPTKFPVTVPTISTDSMRQIVNDPEFDYELACAELCGSAHYNMRKVVKIVSLEEYEAWKKEQKSYYETVVKPLQATN